MIKNKKSGTKISDARIETSRIDPEKAERAGQILKSYPISDTEKELFLESEKRINRLLGIEKYRAMRIVVEIEESTACLAGHSVGDRIYFNTEGFLLTDNLNKPVCARLLNKIWYRLIMIMDRIADRTGDYIGNGLFEGDILQVRMTCYGADFPYGDCGQVLMKVFIESCPD